LRRCTTSGHIGHRPRPDADFHAFAASTGAPSVAPKARESYLQVALEPGDVVVLKIRVGATSSEVAAGGRAFCRPRQSLLAIVGCGPLTAAKIVGETGQVRRFRSKDAFARLNGTAPLPVWSSNKQRHRLSRTGNRQFNTALHRIAMTQARIHPPARELLQRRQLDGDGGMEALRILKRRLS
jgi:hypothetical protein